ncbi:hypothetical protein BDF19DRAFT_415867 [Syncephalis fuscata]|nr:hypothetical protein BDF19DRAFT_415867 [Syncephalis fuscata]
MTTQAMAIQRGLILTILSIRHLNSYGPRFIILLSFMLYFLALLFPIYCIPKCVDVFYGLWAVIQTRGPQISRRGHECSGCTTAVLPPPRIVAYRSIRTRRHYGGTENTRVNLSELSSDEEDNRPLGIRYTTRINHLSVSAPASASTQPLVASSPSPPLNEGHSGHEAHYRITNGHHPSENYTAQEEEETIKALDIEQNGLTNTVECPICYDPFVDSDIVMELGCRHTFHSGCIGQWLRRRHPTCPMCRAHIPTHGLDYRLLRMPSRYSNGFNALNYAEDPTYRLSRDYASHFVNHQMNDDPTNGERRPLLLDR